MANTKRTTEPAVDPAAEIKPPTVDEAVQGLIAALGLDERNVKGLDVLPTGRIRVFGVDNSARGEKFTPLRRWERDANGRVIE